jgi:hypothetical protein
MKEISKGFIVMMVANVLVVNEGGKEFVHLCRVHFV